MLDDVLIQVQALVDKIVRRRREARLHSNEEKGQPEFRGGIGISYPEDDEAVCVGAHGGEARRVRGKWEGLQVNALVGLDLTPCFGYKYTKHAEWR